MSVILSALSTRRSTRTLLAITGVGLLFLLVHLMVGTVPLAPNVVALSLLDPAADAAVRAIVWNVRLPRVLNAATVGALLGVAAALLQRSTPNAPADSALLGLAPGAALGAVMVLALQPSMAAAHTRVLLATLGGAVFVGRLVLAFQRAEQPRWLLIAGTIINIVLPLVGLALLLDGVRVGTFVRWCLGTFEGRGWTTWTALWPWALGGLPLGLLAAWWVDHTLPTSGTRSTLWLLAALLTVGTVLAAGALGFVGLTATLLTRQINGRHNALCTALFGAALLLVADLVARLLTLALPSLGVVSEVPVGIVLWLLGMPLLARIAARSAFDRPSDR